MEIMSIDIQNTFPDYLFLSSNHCVKREKGSMDKESKSLTWESRTKVDHKPHQYQ